MKFKFGIYFLLSLFLMTSCASSKKVTYFQKGSRKKDRIVDISSYRLESTVRFKPDDILGITINVPQKPEVAADFNLPLVPLATSENSLDEVPTGAGRQNYLINKEGEIDFPVLGKIKVAALNQGELEDYLKVLLSEYISAPIVVTVRLTNFRILVTGEVNRPGYIPVDRDQINLLEALALAGDMTIYGKRDEISLFRQLPNGNYRRIYLDINKQSIISSPYFFLQQNDEIYVEQVKAKAQSADISPMLSTIMGITTFALSLVTFVLMVSN